VTDRDHEAQERPKLAERLQVSGLEGAIVGLVAAYAASLMTSNRFVVIIVGIALALAGMLIADRVVGNRRHRRDG
jgi:hypothetical protein